MNTHEKRGKRQAHVSITMYVYIVQTNVARCLIMRLYTHEKCLKTLQQNNVLIVFEDNCFLIKLCRHLQRIFMSLLKKKKC